MDNFSILGNGFMEFLNEADEVKIIGGATSSESSQLGIVWQNCKEICIPPPPEP